MHEERSFNPYIGLKQSAGQNMEKVRLGRTDLVVMRLGWGGIPIQRVTEQEAISVIGEVMKLGVDLLDTARSYTNSEYRIGLAFQEIRRPILLSSKSHLKTKEIYEDIRKSLHQMKVKKIPIYHVHNVSTFEEYEKVMAPGGAYEGLKLAQRQGLIDFIGLSSHNLRVLERVIEEEFFDVIMACYSFLEPEADNGIFSLAKKKDIGILVMKPFSGGVIEDPSLALKFVLSQPGVVPIPGSETLEKAKENWRIFKEGGLLTQEDRERIEAIRKEHDQTFCRRCDYCQPCPEGISIQHILGVKAIVKRFGHTTQELDWFRSLIQKSRNCSECGECQKRCPYQLPIPELIRKNLAWYDGLNIIKITA